MQILIYDDTKNDVNFLEECISDFFQNKCYQYAIRTCENTKYLFEHLNEFDLIFLDVEIGDENGIKIGLEIRKINKDIKIIIVSSYSKYLIDGYKVHAERYFLKPFTKMEFNLEFENIVNSYFSNFEGLYDEKISNVKIYFKDILYIDFYGRKTRIHFLNSKIIITPYSLKHWETACKSQPFSKSHKSFLVNLRHISGFMKTDVILVNEELIPLSRRFKNELDNNYLKYLHMGL